MNFIIHSDDIDQHLEHLNGPGFLYCLQDIDDLLREIVKYSDTTTVQKDEFAGELRMRLREIMEDREVLQLLER